MQHSAMQLILQAGYVVKVVLLILLFFSVVSWAIIFYKYRYLSRANKETDVFLRSYRAGRDLKGLLTAVRSINLSPLANIFKFTSSENIVDKAEIKRSLRRFSALESAKLEKYLSFLATTVLTTPFIGLFGTVWGIMNSFRGDRRCWLGIFGGRCSGHCRGIDCNSSRTRNGNPCCNRI